MTQGSLLAQARAGSHLAVGRLLSQVESAQPTGGLAVGRARVIGLTGPPGAGKSTLTAALITVLREKGASVAVLAVDPSSPFSGGALLGDRIRMNEHSTDPGVFIRSMAARGHLGGLAAAAPAAVRVLDACGFDWILVETVGVGQSEVEIAQSADTTVVVLAPGAGDGVQAAKAGVLEVGDIFVVNKADRDGAQATSRDLRQTVARGLRGWQTPVLITTATEGGGIQELAASLDEHQKWLQDSGNLLERRRRRAASEVLALAVGLVHRDLVVPDDVSDAVVAGTLDPDVAARSLIG